MTFEEYIEELCRQHPHILHEVDDKCHFSCLADDAQTKLARNMHYPCVVVYKGDFAFNGSVGNVLMNTEYSIMFLTHVRDTGNSVEVLVSFAKMKRLSLDFLRKISRDKKKKPELRQMLGRFSVIGSEGHRIYFKDSGLYGYVLFLNTDESFNDADCEQVFKD